MSPELLTLLLTAASIGFIHTILGPDHYLPFIAMSQSGKWSLSKTTWVTLLCGFGHVLSSVLLGIIGIAFGLALTNLEIIDSFRGNIAAWGLITFGLVYFIWGVRKALRNKKHNHHHIHKNGILHNHSHSHKNEHMHAHENNKNIKLTPWVLFTIFVLGPCEPFIPLLMYPAANNSMFDIVLVTAVFAGVTILTMLGVVLISIYGISFMQVVRFEKYIHAMAGATILLCGISIQFLGL